MRRKFSSGGIVVIGAISLIFAVLFLTWPTVSPPARMERTARAMVGRSETELVKAMGQAKHIVSAETLAGRSVDYPWKGMHFVPVPNHPVRNKVLLYSKWDTAIYVYIDERGIVEHVATAGT